MESHARSIAKAVSYRIIGTLTTTCVIFVLSRDIKLSLGAGLLDTLLKIAVYFLHERIWNNIHFGREKAPEYEI